MKNKLKHICRHCISWHDIGKTLDVNWEYILNSSISRKVGTCDIAITELNKYTTETYGCDKFALD